MDHVLRNSQRRLLHILIGLRRGGASPRLRILGALRTDVSLVRVDADAGLTLVVAAYAGVFLVGGVACTGV